MQKENLAIQKDKAFYFAPIQEKLHTSVILVYRKPLPGVYSIEYLFHNIYRELEKSSAIQEFELPWFSKGIIDRISNMKALFQFRKCIVHITGDCYYAILGAVFCKRVITIHDLSFLTRTSGFRRHLLKVFWIALPCLFAHRITVVSEATKKALLGEVNINPEKVQVIYNFIDPIYQPVLRNFDKGKPRILQVGTDFNKNLNNLVKALVGMPCTLTIIGRLSEAQKIMLNEAQIQFVSKHSLTIEELYQEFKMADLLTFVSTVEGFGMPILEAQATGLPIITSNCSSMPEVAGKGALLVDPHDIESIRKGILNIVDNGDLRAALVAEGYNNVKRFTKQKIAADYLNVYKSL